MRCEIPVLLRCCFCFPLRHGLLAWAYFKQIFSLFILTSLIVKVISDYGRIKLAGNIVSGIMIFLIVLDMVFHVFFIISAHTKDYKRMRIFYRYSVAVISVNMVLCLIVLALFIYNIYMMPIILLFLWTIILPAFVLTLLLFCIQGYLIILVRSEFIKLKNNSQFEFSNHAADEKCTANLDFLKDIPVTV